MKLKEIKEGDVLRCDGGFTCVAEGELVAVNKAADGSLWFACSSGKHFLGGQLDTEGNVIGLTKVDNKLAALLREMIERAKAALGDAT